MYDPVSSDSHHEDAMKEEKKVRGIFEFPGGSGVWWVNVYIAGKRHRKKIGRKSDAAAYYQKAKADARRGILLPELRPKAAPITFGDLAAAAVEHAKTHLKSWPDYDWKERALREPFGLRPAAEVTPQEIDQWLTGNTRTPATANRFRAFFSLSYRLGMENGKVPMNPARLVRARRENNARLRFLSREDYDRLLRVIRRDFPRQAPAFKLSVYTGMRWSEQFKLKWSQVELKRRVIRLAETKDPTGRVQSPARNVPLNSVALASLNEQRSLVNHKPADLVFPEAGDYCRFWFEPCLAGAKVTGYTWHCNRHTFCSWLAMAGVSIKEIQELAGHKTIAMSARYAHLSPDVTASASERMVSTLLPGPTATKTATRH
jgi:integrase